MVTLYIAAPDAEGAIPDTDEATGDLGDRHQSRRPTAERRRPPRAAARNEQTATPKAGPQRHPAGGRVRSAARADRTRATHTRVRRSRRPRPRPPPRLRRPSGSRVRLTPVCSSRRHQRIDGEPAPEQHIAHTEELFAASAGTMHRWPGAHPHRAARGALRGRASMGGRATECSRSQPAQCSPPGSWRRRSRRWPAMPRTAAQQARSSAARTRAAKRWALAVTPRQSRPWPGRERDVRALARTPRAVSVAAAMGASDGVRGEHQQERSSIRAGGAGRPPQRQPSPLRREAAEGPSRHDGTQSHGTADGDGSASAGGHVEQETASRARRARRRGPGRGRRPRSTHRARTCTRWRLPARSRAKKSAGSPTSSTSSRATSCGSAAPRWGS